MKFTIITKQGEFIPLNQWQALYGLEVGSNKIGRHFSIGEAAIHDGGKISELVIRVLDRYRELKGKAVIINSLDRTQAKQEELTAAGYRTATFSPHVVGMAADIDTLTEQDTYDQVSVIVKAAKLEGIKIRLGYHQYLADGNTFIHIDVCPEYYASTKPFYMHSHPKPWENTIVW